MMARSCDACKRVIEQKNAEALNVHVRVIDCEEDDDQDPKAEASGEFCDGCISDGSALTYLLKAIDWTLEPKPS